METLEFIRSSVEAVNGMVDTAMQDLTNDVVNYQPGGTANTIAQLLAHVVSGQDLLINDKLSGGRSLHETGWAEKTGIPLDRTMIWQRDGWRLDLTSFDTYRREVASCATRFVDSLTLEALDRETFWVRGPSRPLALMLQVIFINHGLGHCGEISALKGVQGLKGLPI